MVESGERSCPGSHGSCQRFGIISITASIKSLSALRKDYNGKRLEVGAKCPSHGFWLNNGRSLHMVHSTMQLIKESRMGSQA